MSELKHENRKRNGYGNKCRESSYHSVVKGCTDNLDSDELDLYRFMIGGMQHRKKKKDRVKEKKALRNHE